MISSKIFGITVAIGSVLAVTSSAMAFEQSDRMQSERSFYDNGAVVDAYAGAYAGADRSRHGSGRSEGMHDGYRASRMNDERVYVAPEDASTGSAQRAIDRLSERQS
jgi:hypothetical protein